MYVYEKKKKSYISGNPYPHIKNRRRLIWWTWWDFLLCGSWPGLIVIVITANPIFEHFYFTNRNQTAKFREFDIFLNILLPEADVNVIYFEHFTGSRREFDNFVNNLLETGSRREFDIFWFFFTSSRKQQTWNLIFCELWYRKSKRRFILIVKHDAMHIAYWWMLHTFMNLNQQVQSGYCCLSYVDEWESNYFRYWHISFFIIRYKTHVDETHTHTHPHTNEKANQLFKEDSTLRK